MSWFIWSASVFIIKDTNALETISLIITIKLDGNAEDAFYKLSKLLDDKAGCPIIYNYYYTDNVQRVRNNYLRQDLGMLLNNVITKDWNGRFYVSNLSDEIGWLVVSLQSHHIIVDMEERACCEAQIDLEAYYKVCSFHGILGPHILTIC